METVDEISTAERAHFDARYDWDGAIPVDTSETFKACITPEYERNGVPGGLVHREVWERASVYGLAGRSVLDYASGAGHWGIRLAQEGASVEGFDFSAVGVERANRRAAVARVDATFSCADASNLPYEDGSFDLVVGIGALHHTVKYPDTARELHRVMRPGALALFADALEGNWFLQLGRAWTMRNDADAGDVILTEPMVREWAAAFSNVEIDRYKLLLMAKKLGLPYQILAILHRIDLKLFKLAPFTRRWCGECVITLRK